MPAKLAARVHLLSTGHGRKFDQDDALSGAVVAATSRNLRPVQQDIASVELKVLTEYRDDLVRTRTQTVNRLHAIMNPLVLAGAPRQPSADTAAKLLRRVDAEDDLTVSRRMIAVDLVTEIRRLDKPLTAVTECITTQAASTGPAKTPGTGATSECHTQRGEGKTKKEALRALKRRLATVVYRRMLTDAEPKAAGPAGQSGTALISSVTGSHPFTGSSEKSLAGPTRNQPNQTAA